MYGSIYEFSAERIAGVYIDDSLRAIRGARSVQMGGTAMMTSRGVSSLEPYWTRIARQRLGRRRALGLAAAGAGAASLMAACGQRSTGAGKPSQSGAQAGGTQQPKSGGTLTVHQTDDPSDWDTTYLGRSSANIGGIEMAYDTLIGFKSGPGIDYNNLVLQPQLAEKWESPDGQTYTFHLRPGIKFANVPPVNGRDLTSEDVKFSFQYESRTGPIKDKKLAKAWNQWMYEGMTDIQTPDPNTVVVKFEKPYAPFLNYIAYTWNPIMPHEIYDQDGNFKNRIAGTGPFQMDTASSQKGNRWVFKKNPAYWDKGKPYMDQVTILIIPDDATAQAAFQTKQLDILEQPGVSLSPTTVQQVKQQRADARVQQWIDPAPVHLYMMTAKPPLNDQRVRQAVSYAIDRDEWVKTITAGQGGWALAGALPDTFSQEEIKQMLKYDPAQSKQLLAAAGFANGLDLDMPYPGTHYGQVYIQEMQLLQAQMKKVGINLNLKNNDFSAYLKMKHKGDYGMIFTGKALAPDVDSYLYAVFFPGSSENYTFLDDPVLTPLLVAERETFDPAKRKQVIQQAVKRINVDKVWALALFDPVNYDISSPRVQNYARNFGHNSWPLNQAWLAS